MILSDGETLGVFLPWLGFYHCVFCEGSEVVPALDQLASAVNEFGTISFEYDSVGNRLQQTLNGNTATAGGSFFHPIHGSCQTGFLSSLFFCTIFSIPFINSFSSYSENMSSSTKVWYSFVFFFISSTDMHFSISTFSITKT